ncbi:uncharacterized protein M6B38_326505 [Iris pallida]|uniref:Uncharacterized protein n=1 Tax=Iris pallida TaxID=29817 RepID=A0AAX6H6R0_IRIPA|nr:uncharacterized protein M6B38_326505 [Iris pallida]
MRVHPVLDIGGGGGFRCDSARKKLRRLPHIFSKVLELPLSSDAAVSVSESPTYLRFSSQADDLSLLFLSSAAGVRAHAVEIHPGVMKVVVRKNGGGDFGEGEMELDRWRFRLPKGTRPRLAVAEYVEGELVVTVPKGFDDDDEDRDGNAGFVGLGRMLLVQ